MADRIEITSAGILPEGLSEEAFFDGVSFPRNRELMRVYRDLDLSKYQPCFCKIIVLGRGLSMRVTLILLLSRCGGTHLDSLDRQFEESIHKI
ncbi:ATP-binding protein [Sphingobacterium paucimobilis]|uniref:ATP-binding protein n=1 Tax=Sphingobacterium paucimobilis TaxID=1385985 RepID=UPI0009DBD250